LPGPGEVPLLAEVLGSGLPDDYRALAPRVDLEALAPHPSPNCGALRAQAYRDPAWGQPLWSAGGDVHRTAVETSARLAARRMGGMLPTHAPRKPDWPWFRVAH